MDQGEVGRAALTDHARVRLAQQLAAAPGDAGQRLPRLQARLHQALDLPGQLVGPGRTAAEVGAADDQLLVEYEAASLVPPSTPASVLPPAVFSIRPAPDSPAVKRLATDGALLQAALEAGRTAAHSALRGYIPTP